MLAALYDTKKKLKASIGKRLHYWETSAFGAQYRPDGVLTVVGPTPHSRKFYARVTMKSGLIEKVT